jgi:hypothetical protein
MTDLTGKLRLEIEDPRWLQLFRSKCILKINLEDSVFHGFCQRFLKNTRISNNFLQLFEQASSRIRYVLSRKKNDKKSSRFSANNELCCVSIHLISLFMNYFASILPPSEVSFLIHFLRTQFVL